MSELSKEIFCKNEKYLDQYQIRQQKIFNTTASHQRSLLNKKRHLNEKQILFENVSNIECDIKNDIEYLNKEKSFDKSKNIFKKLNSLEFKKNKEKSLAKENLNSSSTLEASSENMVFEVRRKNQSFPFLFDIKNKDYSKNTKNVRKKFKVNHYKIEPKIINLGETIGNEASLAEKIEETNSKIGLYSDSEFSSGFFNIYLPDSEVDDNSDIYLEKSNSNHKFNQSNLSNNQINISEKFFPYKDQNIQNKSSYKTEDLITKISKVSNNPIQNNSSKINDICLTTEDKISNIDKILKKPRKKRKNFIDELMKDSFLKCFNNQHQKNKVKYQSIKRVIQLKNLSTKEPKKNNRNTEFISEGKKKLKKIKELQYNVLKTSDNYSEEREPSTIESNFCFKKDFKLAENSKNSAYITSLVNFNSCEIEDNFFQFKLDNKKSNEEREINISQNKAKKNLKLKKINKRISYHSRKYIRDSKLHKFMFKYFPREYYEKVFRIRFLKQQKRRKNSRENIFISHSLLNLKSLNYLNYLNRKGEESLNEMFHIKKLWDPNLSEENLISILIEFI